MSLANNLNRQAPQLGSRSSTSTTTGDLDVLWAAADRLELATPTAVRSRRASERIQYRRDLVRVVFRASGDTQARAAVGRDLSAGGVGLFCRNFVYPSTTCEVTLVRHLGGDDVVTGHVAYCTHLAGPWHQVGVKFDKQVYPSLFLTPKQAQSMKATLTPAVRIEGGVVVVEPDDLERQLIAFHLKALGATPIEAASVDSAADQFARRKPGRAVLAVIANLDGLAVEADGSDRETSVKRLQAAIGVPVVVVRGGNEPTPQGTTALDKPLTQGGIAAALISAAGLSGDAEPIRSAMTDEQPATGDLAELLNAAVRRIRRAGVEMAQVAAADDVEASASGAKHLQFMGTSFGYGPLAQAAGEVVAALAATQDLTMCETHVERLCDVCRRVIA